MVYPRGKRFDGAGCQGKRERHHTDHLIADGGAQSVGDYKQYCLGVLGWRPNEFLTAHPRDVAAAIIGSIKHQVWQSYSEAQNLKRLTYAVSLIMSGQNPDEVFEFGTKQLPPDKIEDIASDLSNHFDANI